MLRSLLAVIGSAFIGANVIRLLGLGINSAYPMPEDLIVNDEATYVAFFESLPQSVYYWILSSHLVGALITGFLAYKIALTKKKMLGLISIALLIGLILYSIIIMPSPIWLKIVDPILILVIGYLGIYLAQYSSKSVIE